ncbi:AraC family transcriptional regulator [Roseateles sp. DAIF2]|uniref:AraC family transcriptional regulator n=1 Tax=Roseateles sp. DAIF2 TaxID=2714952 RepID=UPI0018A2B9D4|nr:AraC family transcriptional regulator [Roseateles sp. DAIF2]QPF75945.1 AraC family transcriptional regulator [Roseateles sp. DAIF2]
MSPPPTIDRLSSLLDRFKVRTRLFHNGPLCGISRFPAEPGRGFLHVMRRGELELRHGAGQAGLPRRLRIDEPTLLFYPRPLAHEFRNPPEEGSDFVCAELEFDGGALNPLVRALPPLLVLPLARVEGLELSLQLLFSETERLRCGQRLLADRLFEVVLIQLLRWLIDHPAEAGVQPGLVTGLSDPRLARALVALHEDPGAAWSLEAMAERAGMSRSAFAAHFKAVLDQTPANYLADWRLTLAQARLRQGRPVKQIADELGYANASALSRLFSQRLGQSPRQWLDGAAATAAAESLT